jgi:hypothetical protein
VGSGLCTRECVFEKWRTALAGGELPLVRLDSVAGNRNASCAKWIRKGVELNREGVNRIGKGGNGIAKVWSGIAKVWDGIAKV